MRTLIAIVGSILVLVLFLSGIVLAAPSAAPSATCIWNGTTGNWSDAARWSCGTVPGAGDTATINGGTVNVTGDVTVQNLILSGGTLQGSESIAVTNVMTWTNGTQSGSGATTIASGATLNVSGNAGVQDQRTLNNAGTINWTATNQWAFSNGAVLNNLTGATFNAQANGVTLGYYGNGVFNNQGTFVRSGPGVSYVGVPFYNSGTVQVVSGTLRPDNGGNSSGAFTTDVGAVFQFHSNYTLNPGATLTGAGLYRLTGGTLTISGTLTVPNFEQTGATLAGSGTLTVTGVMTWTNGTQSGSGATMIASGATLNVSGNAGVQDQRTLNNAGTVNWTATNQWAFSNGAVLNNLTGATFNAQANGVTLGYYGNGVFNNQGTFVRSGPGVSYVGVPFNNSNLVQAQSGTLHFDGGGNSHGVFAVSGGAALNFGGGTHIVTLGPADSLSGVGTVVFGGGTTTITGTGTYSVTGSTDVAGGTVNFNLPALTTQANQSGGTLGGSGTLTVTGMMTWTNGTQSGSGATTIASGATLNVSGNAGMQDQRTLNNAGTVNWTAVNQWAFSNGAVLNNLAGATFNAQANGVTLGYYGNGVFNNQGTFVRSGPGSSSVAVPFNNTGTVNVEAGVLQFSNSFAQNAGATWLSGGSLTKSGALVFNGGTLGGKGTITGTVSNIGGTVLPGSSPGILRIAGNYTQGPTGTLNIELGGTLSGTQYDLLDVTGNATLSGTLAISLINSYTPISGTVFRVMNFGARSGDFITNTGSDLGNGLFVSPYYSSDHLSLMAGTPVADLGLSLTDGKDYAITGDPITYTLVVTNAGPNPVSGALITDTLPGAISGVTWTCAASGGSCSTPSGTGNISATVNLNAGGGVTITVGGRLALGTIGPLTNTAYVSHFSDPDTANNTATDIDTVLHLKLYLPVVISQ